jgi:polar amino acid transport system substrate-binding protein
MLLFHVIENIRSGALLLTTYISLKFRSVQLVTALLFLSLAATHSHSREQVRVGVAHFPPFIINTDGIVGGLAADMLALMNAEQLHYEFVAVPTLADTRHEIFKLGRYDMSMFDSLAWGWEGFDVDASEVYLRGGEIYIALAKPGRDQSYFDNLLDKKMIGIKGYHYAFAGFNSDPEYLAKTYQMSLSRSNQGSIQMLLSGMRGDIAVITRSFLAIHLQQNPQDKEKLLLSDKMDQTYEHRIILRRNISPTIDEINKLLSQLKRSGQLDALWKQIQITPQQLPH